MNKLFTFILLFAFTSQSMAAPGVRTSAATLGISEATEQGASEFVVRRYPGERLIPVRILGGVTKPGTYYFPEGVDLLSAISLSGGLVENADASSVMWTKFSTQQYQTLDLANAMKKPKDLNPALGANDVLFIDSKTSLISNNTILLLSVISSLVGIAVGVTYLSKR